MRTLVGSGLRLLTLYVSVSNETTLDSGEYFVPSRPPFSQTTIVLPCLDARRYLNPLRGDPPPSPSIRLCGTMLPVRRGLYSLPPLI